MDKALAILDGMEPLTGGYNYRDSMAKDIEKLMRENWPGKVKLLTGGAWKLSVKGNYGKASRDDFRDMVFSRLQTSGAYKWLGLGSEIRLMQWQYKSFVKRAGAQVLEAACAEFKISRSAVIDAMFSNDWQSLDELIRYHFLGAAVEAAIDSIQVKGVKK